MKQSVSVLLKGDLDVWRFTPHPRTHLHIGCFLLQKRILLKNVWYYSHTDVWYDWQQIHEKNQISFHYLFNASEHGKH